MNKKLILEEIKTIVETISEQTQTICSYEKKIPQIEIDIVKVNIRDLYEAFHQLDKQNKDYEKVMLEKNEVKQEKIQEITPEPVIEKISDTPKEEEITKNTPVTKQIVQEKETKEIPIEKPVEKPVEKETTKSVDLFSDAPTITDKFKNDTKSINEKIAQTKNDATIAGKMKQTPITDLKLAIGINEKFRFVNELFEGNLSDYNESINKLNALDNIENAENYFNSLAAKYKWNINSNTCIILKNIVSRRYQK